MDIKNFEERKNITLKEVIISLFIKDNRDKNFFEEHKGIKTLLELLAWIILFVITFKIPNQQINYLLPNVFVVIFMLYLFYKFIL